MKQGAVSKAGRAAEWLPPLEISSDDDESSTHSSTGSSCNRGHHNKGPPLRNVHASSRNPRLDHPHGSFPYNYPNSTSSMEASSSSPQHQYQPPTASWSSSTSHVPQRRFGARISEPRTSDYRHGAGRARSCGSSSPPDSAAVEQAETQSCFSSFECEDEVRSIRRELLRRSTSLLASERDNSILDDADGDDTDAGHKKQDDGVVAAAIARLQLQQQQTNKRSTTRSPPPPPPPIETASDHQSPTPTKKVVNGRPNRVQLHVYDLIKADTLVQFPSPLNCVCEIGKCFNDVNSALHELGTGAYQ